MENLLFDWDGWDEQDTMAFTFYKPKLKVDLSMFDPRLVIGATFDCADIDYGNGFLQFSNSNDDDVEEVVIVLKLGFFISLDGKQVAIPNTLEK